MATPDNQAQARLASLIEINQLLLRTVDPEEVLQVILASALRLFGVEGCSLGLLDDSGQQLAFVVMEGPAHG